jgi:hypothetical protein
VPPCLQPPFPFPCQACITELPSPFLPPSPHHLLPSPPPPAPLTC